MFETTMDFEESKAVAFAMDLLLSRVPEGREYFCLRRDNTLKEQSYHFARVEEGIEVRASDEAGMMYGLLDLADLYDEGWSADLDQARSPRIQNRGIKLNVPLDARTPSYSDASTSAFENIPHVWEWSFWTEFLDTMARAKFNMLSLWSLSPFPSLVKVPEYPDVALTDVMRSTIPPRPEMSGENMWTSDMEEGLYTVQEKTIEEKIKFWQNVMAYARDRCIRVYIFTWNLFVFGTEGNPYGITCDQSNPITRDYIYCAVKALLRTYPLLAGIGITAGEHMAGDDTDISFLRNTYGRAMEEILQEQQGRKLELIHRMQYARYGEIKKQFDNFKGDFSVSFKYAQAHLHSLPKPSFFQDFLEETASEDTFWLTMRDDDYYLYRWGNYRFARAFLQEIPVDRIKGFYLGADGFSWGRDYTSYRKEHPLYLEKMWYKFSLLGKLSYCLDIPQKTFCREMSRRFGLSVEKTERLENLWADASSVFCLLHGTHWNDFDFQWYPEGCCRFLHPPIGKLVFADINEFIQCQAMPGTPYLSVRTFCQEGGKEGAVSPLETAFALQKIGETVAQGLMEFTGDGELADTLADIRALGLLGSYYGKKIEAAVYLCRFRLDRTRTNDQQEAVRLLEMCAKIWKQYSAFSKAHYRPQRLTRMGGNYVEFTAFDRWAELDVELAQYQ